MRCQSKGLMSSHSTMDLTERIEEVAENCSFLPPSLCCRYLEFKVDAVTTAVSDHRANHRLVCHLTARIVLAQLFQRNFADLVDQAGELRVARDDELKRDEVCLRAFGQVRQAAAVPLVVDVGFGAFHELLLSVEVQSGTMKRRVRSIAEGAGTKKPGACAAGPSVYRGLIPASAKVRDSRPCCSGRHVPVPESVRA